MIRYALKCESGHEFQGWFRSSEDYERQAARRAVECPDCGSLDVSKAIMAPSVARTDERGAQLPVPAPGTAPHPAAGPPNPKQMATFFSAMRRHVEENFDYVGEEFTEEARKIHYGEAEARDIYGEATLEEAKELIEEGVEIAPLPGAKKRRSRARAN